MSDLNASRCNIFVVDIEAATGMRLPPRYLPENWEHNQYAVELWMRRAIEKHPWRVQRPEAADIVFAAANLSQWCVAGKTFTRRRLWDAAFPTKPGVSGAVPKAAEHATIFVARQYEGSCGPAQSNRPLSDKFLLLREEILPDERHLAHHRVVSPFLVSKPKWLVGAAPLPFTPPAWQQRKLIFFAGHVPKPYIRDTRYTLWRQLRNDPRATVLSPTLYCTVGGFAACHRHNFSFLEAQNGSFLTSICRFACDTSMSLGGSRRVMTTCLVTSRTAKRYVPVILSDLKKKCWDGYAGVNFEDELEDMRRDTRRLPHPEYLRLGMSHRFCLVAPGDFVSTHKVSEAMSLGGAGGCIPIFVLPAALSGATAESRVDVVHHLPYTRWLDWCSVAYFVSEYYAREAMGAVTALLEALPEEEIARKRARLREVRSAFTFRSDSSLGAPSASEWIFAEACAAARRLKELKKQAHSQAARSVKQLVQTPPRGAAPPSFVEEEPPAAGGDHERCVLLASDRRKRGRRRGSNNWRPPVGGVVPGGYRYDYRAAGW